MDVCTYKPPKCALCQHIHKCSGGERSEGLAFGFHVKEPSETMSPRGLRSTAIVISSRLFDNDK